MTASVEKPSEHLVSELAVILGQVKRKPEELAPITRAEVLDTLVQLVVSRKLEDFRFLADIASTSEKDSKEFGARIFGKLAFNAPRLADGGVFPELVWGRNFMPLVTFAGFPEPEAPVAWSTDPAPKLPQSVPSTHLVLVKPKHHPTEEVKIGIAKLIILWDPLPVAKENRTDGNPWFAYPLSWVAREFSVTSLGRNALARELKRPSASPKDDSLRHAMYRLAAIDIERVKSARRVHEKEVARSSKVRGMFDLMSTGFY